MIAFHEFEQLSDEWFEIRLGKVTGSIFKRIKGAPSTGLMNEMIAEKLSGLSEKTFPNAAMKWGTDTEPDARRHYESVNEVTVDEIGFVTNSKYENLGVSPDGLIGKNGAVEFKCPSSKQHIDVMLKNAIPKDYIPQVLLYFIVMENVEWVDFVTFDPRIIERPMFTIRVTREEWKPLIEEYIKLYAGFSIKMEESIDDITF